MPVWNLTLPVDGDNDPISISSADMSAGEWSAIYELAANALPHAELDVSPLHCPLCRNAIAVVALTRRGIDMGVASAVVRDMGRDELLGCVSVADG